MPNDYHCKSCHLFFSIGWYHFHTFESGFASATLLACSGCGTAYRIDHAIGRNHADELRAQPEPMLGVDEGSGLYWKSFKEWQPYEADGTLRPEREEHEGYPAYFEAITDNLDLSQVTCHYCKGKGLLLVDWLEVNEECPRCHNTSLVCDSMWIT